VKFSRYLNGRVLVCLFLLLLTLISGQITYYVENSKTMVVMVFAGIVSVWLAVRSIRRRDAVTVDLGVLLLGGYFLWHALVTVVGSGYDTSFYYAKAFGFFAVFVWARQIVRREDLPLYPRVLPVVTALLGVVWLGGFLLTWQGLLHFESIRFDRPLNLTFGNQNYLGCFCAMSAPLMVSAALNEKADFWRWLSGAGFLLAILMGLATQSRLTFTVMALAPAALVLIDLLVLRGTRWYLAVGATAAYLLAYLTAVSLLQMQWIEGNLSTTLSGSNESDIGHLVIWRATWSLIGDDAPRFLFGHGWGYLYQHIFTFPFERIHYAGPEKEFRYAHCEYLDIWLEGGLVGLGLFLALVITTLVKLARIVFALEKPRKRIREKSAPGAGEAIGSKGGRDGRANWERALALSLAGGICAYLAFGLVDPSTRYTVTQFPFLLLMVSSWALIAEPLKVPAPAWSTVPLAVLALYASWIGIRNFAADHYFMSSVKISDKDPKTAAEWLDKALWWDPNHVEALARKLFIAVSETNLETGREYWKRLNNTIPQFQKAGEMYSHLLYQTQQFDDAVAASRDYIDANYYDIDGRSFYAIYLLTAELRDDYSRQIGEILRVYMDLYNLGEGTRFEVRLTESPETVPVLEVVDGRPIGDRTRYQYNLRELGQSIMDPPPERFSEARRRILRTLSSIMQSDYGLTQEEFTRIFQRQVAHP